MVAVVAAALLERSCMSSAGSPRADFIATDHPFAGIQRLRAGFFGHAYDPHRHETYAVGVTECGIQAFRYRGVDRASTTGMTMVLHPDELHDGHAVAPEGFVYRMLYVDAALIGAALGHAALPFVDDAVGADPVLAAALDEAFEGFPDRFTTLAGAGIVAAVADRLARRAGRRGAARPGRYYGERLDRARDRLDGATDLATTAEDLEAVSGLDRYTLARAFRARFAASPHRYLVGRRLRLVKQGIAAGLPLAEAAIAGGFADQSHMTRHFKARFGLTPGRYIQLLRRSDRSARDG
jgi:AraC-like DNA-binding protein